MRPCAHPCQWSTPLTPRARAFAQRARSQAIGRGAAATILCVMGAIGMAGNSHHAGRGFVPVEGTEVDQRYLALPQRSAWALARSHALEQHLHLRAEMCAHPFTCSDTCPLATVALGHFVADLLWLVYARQRYAQAPRKDLIAHHLLCLLGYTYMMDTPGALLASTAVRVRSCGLLWAWRAARRARARAGTD